MYPPYRGAHANRGRKTESSERHLRVARRGKRLWLTRRRRLRTGREATRFEATSSGQPGRRAERQLRCTELPACRRPRAAEHRFDRSRGHPNCTRGRRIGGAIGVGTGNRVSVNGARAVGRATGSESNFGNGGSGDRSDRAGGHRRRVTGGGADRQRSRATGDRAKTGIARRAFGHDGRCVGRAKANARRSTSGGSSHLSGSPGWVRRRKQAAPPGATHFFGRIPPVHAIAAVA
jgi:hypothetical protein